MNSSTSFFAEAGLLPGLQRLNAIRNRMAHDLNAQLTAEDVVPMRAYVLRMAKGTFEAPSEPLSVIDTFVALACAGILGLVAALRAGKHYSGNKTRRDDG